MHREEKICGLGSEVVNTWFKGIAMGPEAARDCLRCDIDEAIMYRSHQVLRHHKGQVGQGAGVVAFGFLVVVLVLLGPVPINDQGWAVHGARKHINHTLYSSTQMQGLAPCLAQRVAICV